MKKGNRNQGEDKGNELRDSSQLVFHIVSRENRAPYMCTLWLSSPNMPHSERQRKPAPHPWDVEKQMRWNVLLVVDPIKKWIWCLLHCSTGTQLSSLGQYPFPLNTLIRDGKKPKKDQNNNKKNLLKEPFSVLRNLQLQKMGRCCVHLSVSAATLCPCQVLYYPLKTHFFQPKHFLTRLLIFLRCSQRKMPFEILMYWPQQQ